MITGSFNSQKYLDFLINQVKPFGDGSYGPSNYWLYDNSPIHTVQAVRDYLRADFPGRVHDHPPFSPDLNPIEHLGNQLKRLLTKYLPVETQNLCLGLRDIVYAIWAELGDNLHMLSNLALSMHRRYSAVIEAD